MLACRGRRGVGGWEGRNCGGQGRRRRRKIKKERREKGEEGGVLTRCAARSVWLSLNQEPPIFFHKSPSSSYPLHPHRTAAGGRDFKRRRNAEERHAGAGVPSPDGRGESSGRGRRWRPSPVYSGRRVGEYFFFFFLFGGGGGGGYPSLHP